LGGSLVARPSRTHRQYSEATRGQNEKDSFHFHFFRDDGKLSLIFGELSSNTAAAEVEEDVESSYAVQSAGWRTC
jgi:hypothetical protein